MTMKSGYNQMLQTWSISEFYNFYSKKVDHYKCIVGMHMCVCVYPAPNYSHEMNP